MTVNENIIVSICCTTYNHENYIRQCLDGFVMQKTTFPFEILVHEDASTDNTAQIVKEYEAKYPDLFRCVYQTENQFAKQNTLHQILIPMAKGKYIALCEGDDYWTDPLKLQKQVDFLEANEDFIACGHETLVMSYYTDPPSQTSLFNMFGIKPKNIYTGEEFITSIYPFHFSSLVFRNVINYNKKILKIFSKTFSGDNALYAIMGNLGKVYYFNDVMSVYNIRSTGITSNLHGNNLINNLKNIIKAWSSINIYFNKKNDKAFNEITLKYFDKMMFNKSLYQNKFILVWDIFKFVFTNKYGKKSFIAKLKYIIKSVWN